MKPRTLVAILAAVAAAACADLLGVRVERASFVLVPEFGGAAAFADNADRLRIRIQRDSSGTFVTAKDTTVAVNAETGEAAANINVVLLTNPQQFRVLLDAIRSSDGAILFSGVQLISVTGTPAGGVPPSFNIPVTYAGPTGTSIAVSPKDTAVAPGVTFPLVAVVRDASDQVVGVPVTFALAVPGDSTILRVGRITGVVTTPTGAAGETRVVATSADGLTDTARIFVGSTPSAVRVTPGFAGLTTGTRQLTGDVLDGGGNVLSGFAVTWASRTPAAATVSTTGLVSAVAVGQSTVVATSGTFADSTQVVVVPGGHVVAAALANDRYFRRARVGDTVVVDLVADMQFAGEALGSYNATFTFNAAALKYVDTQTGTFGAPTVNATNATTGEVRLGHANATGGTGTVVLARLRFVAQAAGSGTLALTFSEMSAASTFTNLITRVTVASGAVTIVP